MALAGLATAIVAALPQLSAPAMASTILVFALAALASWRTLLADPAPSP